MKRIRTRILAMAVALVLTLGLSGTALAAGTGVSVQLNGKPLTFTDSAPQTKDGRIFLPFRAVAEAMGATVGNSGNTVTASLGGRTLSMSIGSTKATVTAEGIATELTMDTAPYVYHNRTYVPVRFLAEAFDCAVGWDNTARTAVIVDTNQLVRDALAPYHYTYLEGYMDYCEAFNSGNWALDGKLDGTITFYQSSPVKLSATYKGVSAGGEKIQMDMNLKLDIAVLIRSFTDASDRTELTDDQARLLEALWEDGLTVGVRGDLREGILYMSFSGDLFEAAGFPANTWVSMDMKSMMEEMDMDWESLVATSAYSLNLETMLQSALAGTDFDDSGDDYREAKQAVDAIAKFFADESFTQQGNAYTSVFQFKEGKNDLGFSLTFLRDAGKVVGYNVVFNVATEDNGSMKLSAGIDAQNKLSFSFLLDAGEEMKMEMNLSGTYTKSQTAPQTKPPAGATVIPYEDLMNSL